jgi:hypothetical protein
MRSRTNIATMLARTANPVTAEPSEPAWADPEGRAAFERIVATPPDTPPRRLGPRRRLGIAAAVAAAAGAAVAVVGVPGLAHNGAPPAWSVTRDADGSVTVKINDYHDPDGLQAKLRAAGVRANVQTLSAKCSDGTAPLNGGPLVKGWTDDSITPRVWEQLFAGSTVGVIRIHPQYLPPQDTVWAAFPPPGAEGAGSSLFWSVQSPGDGPPWNAAGPPPCFPHPSLPVTLTD